MIKSLVMISYFPTSGSSYSLISLKTVIILLVAGSWFYLVTILACQSWIVSKMGVQKFMDLYFYGIKVSYHYLIP